MAAVTSFETTRRGLMTTAAAMLAAVAGVDQAAAQPAGPPVTTPPALKITLQGAPAVAFRPATDGCDGHDVPDAPLRAFRNADGRTVAFGLHFVNRALRGPDLASLKIDCRVVLASGNRADPAAYDDYRWITATWTTDGRNIAALVHHEYHGNEHPDRCRFRTMMQCWMNTITAWRSRDGGARFVPVRPGYVVAAAPFRQDVGQGRHRGFFNPSNIFKAGRWHYFLASNTGWRVQGKPVQPYGVCLFRSSDPMKPSGWRAWDGKAFSVRYADPYRAPVKDLRPQACAPVAPFPAPVGAVVRHRPSGLWLAVFQASADKTYFPLPGFYYATSRDLLRWSAPRLLVSGKTLYDDPCTSGGQIIAYPSLLDPQARGRNYDDTGSRAFLFYASMQVKGCTITSKRNLIRQRVHMGLMR